MSEVLNPRGRRPRRLTTARAGVYAFLIICALFFLTPLYVMVVTSLKAMPEIREGNILGLPVAPALTAWAKAWYSACTGLTCNGIRVGFVNSLRILIPSVIVSIAVGALTGYALSFWRPRGAIPLFGESCCGSSAMMVNVAIEGIWVVASRRSGGWPEELGELK